MGKFPAGALTNFRDGAWFEIGVNDILAAYDAGESIYRCCFSSWDSDLAHDAWVEVLNARLQQKGLQVRYETCNGDQEFNQGWLTITQRPA